MNFMRRIIHYEKTTDTIKKLAAASADGCNLGNCLCSPKRRRQRSGTAYLQRHPKYHRRSGVNPRHLFDE